MDPVAIAELELERCAKAAWRASLKFYDLDASRDWGLLDDHFKRFWRAIALAVRDEGEDK